MAFEQGRFFKTNVLGQINGVGLILCILVGGTVAFANSSMNGKLSPTSRLDPLTRDAIETMVFLPFVLMTIVQRRVELDAERREGRVGWGVWPLFAWRRVAFPGKTQIRLTGGQGSRGWSVSAYLGSEETRDEVPLAVSGGEIQFEEAIAFGRRLGSDIVASSGIRGIKASSVHRLLPEIFGQEAL